MRIKTIEDLLQDMEDNSANCKLYRFTGIDDKERKVDCSFDIFNNKFDLKIEAEGFFFKKNISIEAAGVILTNSQLSKVLVEKVWKDGKTIKNKRTLVRLRKQK